MASNNVAGEVDPADKYRYFDDIEIIELVMLSDLLVDYDFYNHVASDIATDQKFLPPESFSLQTHLDNIQNWTHENSMKLNYEKSTFIIFTRCKTDFTT